MSEPLNIYQKLIEVRKTVPYLQKADEGAQYKYTGSSRVLAAVKEKMDELGLLLIPSVTGHTLNESTVEYTEKDKYGNEKPKRTTTYFTELEMTMTWVNAEKPDEQIVSSWYGQGVDIAGEKGVGKALTYAEKYFMLKFFNIATDKDDPDAFQAKHDPNAAETQKPANTRKTPQDVGQDRLAQERAKAEARNTGELASEPQVKMLNAKAGAAGYKVTDKVDLMEAVSQLVGHKVESFTQVLKSDVQKIVNWLESQKASVGA